MNVWNFTGNIGRDAETRFSANGTAVTSFSVAVKSGYGQNANTVWVKCSMFGERGTKVVGYLCKGQLVGVSGEMNVREWDDKEGVKKTSIEVRVNDVTLLGKTGGDEGQQEVPARSAQPTRRAPPVVEDDIPFAPINRRALTAI